MIKAQVKVRAQHLKLRVREMWLHAGGLLRGAAEQQSRPVNIYILHSHRYIILKVTRRQLFVDVHKTSAHVVADVPDRASLLKHQLAGLRK